MKTRKQISLDYDRAMEMTGELERLAESLKNELDANTENNLGMLRSGWEGENASKFMNKMGNLKEASMPTVNEIKRLAAGIRSNAQIVYKAEMAAIQIAEKRDS